MAAITKRGRIIGAVWALWLWSGMPVHRICTSRHLLRRQAWKRISNVAPQAPVLGIVNGDRAHAETLGQFANRKSSTGIHLSDGHNVGLSQFCLAVRVAVWMTSLLHHVADVVSARAKKQVCRVHASAIVATMADLYASWDLLPGVKRERKPMRHIALSSAARTKSRVAGFGINRSRPVPAAVRRDFVLSSKSNRWWNASTHSPLYHCAFAWFVV